MWAGATSRRSYSASETSARASSERTTSSRKPAPSLSRALLARARPAGGACCSDRSVCDSASAAAGSSAREAEVTGPVDGWPTDCACVCGCSYGPPGAGARLRTFRPGAGGGAAARAGATDEFSAGAAGGAGAKASRAGPVAGIEPPAGTGVVPVPEPGAARRSFSSPAVLAFISSFSPPAASGRAASAGGGSSAGRGAGMGSSRLLHTLTIVSGVTTPSTSTAAAAQVHAGRRSGTRRTRGAGSSSRAGRRRSRGGGSRPRSAPRVPAPGPGRRKAGPGRVRSSPRPLGAPERRAKVRRHGLREALTRPEEPAHHRAHGKPERLCDLLVRHLLHRPQHEHGPLLGRQAEERSLEDLAGLLLEHALERVAAPGAALPVALGQAFLPRLRRPHVVHRQVGRDAADPGAERPREVEAGQGLVGADERVLGHVVGHVVVAHDTQGDPVDPALVAPNHLLERREIPPLRTGQEARLVLTVGPHASPRARRGLMASTQDTGEGGAIFRGPGAEGGPPRGRTARLLEDLDDDPAVQGPVLLGLVVLHGLAGPVGDHVQAGQGDAVGLGQVVADRHRPLLAQLLVVGLGTGGVGVPLDLEPHPLVGGLQGADGLVDDLLGLIADLGLVHRESHLVVGEGHGVDELALGRLLRLPGRLLRLNRLAHRLLGGALGLRHARLGALVDGVDADLVLLDPRLGLLDLGRHRLHLLVDSPTSRCTYVFFAQPERVTPATSTGMTSSLTGSLLGAIAGDPAPGFC